METAEGSPASAVMDSDDLLGDVTDRVGEPEADYDA